MLVVPLKANTYRSGSNMRKNPLNQGIIMENAAGIGTVATKMVEARARELARINGRGSKPTEADYQQAKRELTGESEIDPQEENLESLPESEGWDVVPGSTGRQAAESLGEDEDAEGRSEEHTSELQSRSDLVCRLLLEKKKKKKKDGHMIC